MLVTIDDEMKFGISKLTNLTKFDRVFIPQYDESNHRPVIYCRPIIFMNFTLDFKRELQKTSEKFRNRHEMKRVYATRGEKYLLEL